MKYPSFTLLQEEYKYCFIGVHHSNNKLVYLSVHFYNINNVENNKFENPYLRSICEIHPVKIINIYETYHEEVTAKIESITKDNIIVNVNNNKYIYEQYLLCKAFGYDVDTKTIKKYMPANKNLYTDIEKKLEETYTIISNGLHNNQISTYILSNDIGIEKELNHLLYLTNYYEYFINPINYNNIINLLYVNIDTIKRELYEFANLNTDYLTSNFIINKHTSLFEEWHNSEINNMLNKNNLYFLPVYYKTDTSDISHHFIKTLGIVANISKLKTAGFMILKKNAEVEWYKHTKESTIIHITISENHDNMINSFVAKDDITKYEKQDMTAYLSTCCFNTSYFHRTKNYSSTDRISFVIELGEEL